MEEVFSIGQPWTLHGIWSDGGGDNKTAVVFLSSGLLRSHGPNRLYVECAQELARQGISSLRFDLSSVGDSLERPSRVELAEQTLAETREVFDALAEQKGMQRFVLVGLCSGAYDGIDIATADERVASVVSLDGYSLKTDRYKLHWAKSLLLPRLLRLSSWQRLFKRVSDGVEMQSQAEAQFLEIEKPEVIAERFEALLARRVSLYCLFTGGVIEEYSYRGQLADALPQAANRDCLTEVYLPQMDHLLMLDDDRSQVVQRIAGHVAEVA